MSKIEEMTEYEIEEVGGGLPFLVLIGMAAMSVLVQTKPAH